MISLLCLLWISAVFVSPTGALRGWRSGLVGTTVALLGLFAICLFDSLLRGSLYLLLTDEQTYFLQMIVYLAIVASVYRSRLVIGQDNRPGIIRDRSRAPRPASSMATPSPAPPGISWISNAIALRSYVWRRPMDRRASWARARCLWSCSAAAWL